eukprot:3785396-Rhodomonas_salina.3
MPLMRARSPWRLAHHHLRRSSPAGQPSSGSSCAVVLAAACRPSHVSFPRIDPSAPRTRTAHTAHTGALPNQHVSLKSRWYSRLTCMDVCDLPPLGARAPSRSRSRTAKLSLLGCVLRGFSSPCPLDVAQQTGFSALRSAESPVERPSLSFPQTGLRLLRLSTVPRDRSAVGSG